MNVLSRRRTSDLAVSGDVLLNGGPISKVDASVGELIGYVQQNDLLPPTLTVREYLTFSVCFHFILFHFSSSFAYFV